MSGRPVLFVIGGHRCGTSATAGALAAAGLDFGGRLLPPSPANPRGYFEDREAVAANDEALFSAGCSWDRPPSLGLISESAKWKLLSRAKAVLAHVDAVKDPRMALLPDVWIQAAWDLWLEPRILRVHRDVNAAARSLMRREGWPAFRAGNVAQAYDLAAFRASNLARSAEITFPDETGDAGAWRRVFRSLGYGEELNAEVAAAWFDPSLVHERGEA